MLSYVFLEISTSWKILINQQLINGIDNINRGIRAAPISSFNFPTFYINNVHNKLFSVLFELIYFRLNANKRKLSECR